MLMSKSLTPLAKRLLRAVQTGNGEWMSRSQIAEDLGRPRNRLNPHDRNLLEQMVADGLLDAEERQIGVVQTERVYRAKS